MIRKSTALLLIAMAVLAMAACSSDGPGGASACGASGDHEGGHDQAPAFAANAATTALSITMKDYVFDGLASRVKGPNVQFETKVAGSNCHELEVIDSAGKAIGAIGAYRGGDVKTLAVALQPGTYTVQCLVKEGSRTHADLGMKVSLAVE